MDGLKSGELGEKIKSMRKNFGINQLQMAEYLGVDQSNISKCESGERNYTVSMLNKIADLFGCSLIELTSPVENNLVNFSFRAESITKEDLGAIAEINRIAINIREMEKLLEV